MQLPGRAAVAPAGVVENVATLPLVQCQIMSGMVAAVVEGSARSKAPRMKAFLKRKRDNENLARKVWAYWSIPIHLERETELLQLPLYIAVTANLLSVVPVVAVHVAATQDRQLSCLDCILQTQIPRVKIDMSH